MKAELDQLLCKKYPKLYQQRDLSPQETAMCWGFPGDGWFDIIDRLSAQIEPLGAVAVQVKEKFGTLRFYVTCPNENYNKIEEAIELAEELSEVTCEYCGKPGRARGGGWIKTLCDDCDKIEGGVED